jgi:ABC-2 type transport system permease protein
MKKILAIVAKDVHATYTDRNLLLLMLATPLVLATIISLAFGDIVSGSNAPIRDIPVALVNLDEGANGQIFVDLLAPDYATPQNTSDVMDCGSEDASTNGQTDSSFLLDLTNTDVLTDAESARAGVNDGRYAAAIIIPADFSDSLLYSIEDMSITPSAIEVYADSNRAVSASVIRSVAEGITSQLLTSHIAISSTYQTLFMHGMGEQSTTLDPCVFTPLFTANAGTLGITQQAAESDRPPMNLLVMFGAAQAVFFALFTANGSALGVLEERDNGTFQRLMMSPTPRTHILLAKLLSTFANVMLQLVFLFVAFMLIASLMDGQLSFIWGTNWPLIIITLIVLALATSGIGMIVAAVAKTAEQASIVGSVLAMFMGAAGGAFFQIGEVPPVFDAITRLSVVRWGQEAFLKLSQGNNDILLNLIALLAIGSVLFLVSALLFIRRQDI